MPGDKVKSVQVLERGFAILEGIAKVGGEATLAQLSRDTGLPHSTVHRILATLLELGYVDQSQDNGRYRMGLRILALSNCVLRNLDVRKVASDHLRSLMEETGETANLVVLDRDEVVYIEKAESKATVRAFSLIGRRAPVHVTGAGKILLSEMARHDIVEILRGKGMKALTPASITGIKPYLEELEAVRRRGYALDDGECEEGVRCIAAPIRDNTGRIIASMSVSGPMARLTDGAVERLAPLVMAKAGAMSRDLGYSEELMEVVAIDR